MVSHLLATKLQIPPSPHHGLRRARLIDSLEQNLPRYKLIRLTAPAGFGKTTLLSQWARSSRHPAAWIALEEEDNNFDRFFRYLLAGWEEVQPGIMESQLGTLLSGMAPDKEAVLAAFINVAATIPEHMAFVLDDYHLIAEASINEAMAFLLDHLPTNLHFVLAGRGEPPLPLARYRARDEVLEFQARDLRFLPEETRDYLNEKMELALSQDNLEQLQEQLEGWIAGLQLVALGIQHHLTGTDSLAVSARHRFIADYLREDVLAPLPEEISRFLLQTSILDRLCGPLCDAVTGTENGQRMLELLERKELFLLPLDDSRNWFRYHQLFAGFLREEAVDRRRPDEIAALHGRAAAWCLSHNLPDEAFRHALAGEKVELVMQLLERYVFLKLSLGEVTTVQRWFDSIPPAWTTTHPVFDLVRAAFFFFTGEFEASVRTIDDVEKRLASAERPQRERQLATVTALRCFVACARNDLELAKVLAEEALGELPPEDLGLRPNIYAALGDLYRQNAHWEQAKTCYLEALRFTEAPAIRVQAAHILSALADLDLRQGRLRQAAGKWRKAIAEIGKRENWGHLPLPVIGWLYTRLGEILYEWNELEGAWDHLFRGLDRAELGGDPRAMIASYLLASRLKLTQGDVDEAAAYLEEARPLVEQTSFAEWISRFQRCQLEVWLAQDRLRTAVNWADEMLQSGQLEERPQSEVTQLALARVLIVKGDTPSLERALVTLGSLLERAEAEGRRGVLIEALALQALAERERGKRAGSMTSLMRALQLAEPEGYVRLFVDLGLPMGRLVQEARGRDLMPDYVDTLLAAYEVDLSAETAAVSLPERLTPREQEVLELLAAGLTNREIGEELVISPQTVKKHTGSIYGKLGVSNRTEAVGRARELDLLA